MSAADHERAVRIATIALRRHMAGDQLGAASYVMRLNGTPGLLVALMGWIDTYIGNVFPGRENGGPVAVAWLEVENPTAEIEGANAVSPALRWAGRLIAARAADDEATFNAILNTATEGIELGDGIMAVLNITATSLTNLDRVRAESGSHGGA